MFPKQLDNNQNQTNEQNPMIEQNQNQMQNQLNEVNQQIDFPEISMDEVDRNNEFIAEVSERIDNNESDNNNPQSSTRSGIRTVENVKKNNIIRFVESNNNNIPTQSFQQKILSNSFDKNNKTNKKEIKSIQYNLNNKDTINCEKKSITEINNYDEKVNDIYSKVFNLDGPPDEGIVNKYNGTEVEKLNSEDYHNANMQLNQKNDAVIRGERDDRDINLISNDEII